jgi:uncharacterized LabA/DUF88 family protein
MWLGRKEIKTAIFWDYENVPIPANNGEKFLEGLKNLIRVSNIEFARVYYRKETMPDKAKESIQKISPFSFKETTITGPNAVDASLITSCMNIAKDSSRNIKCILLISGDKHFTPLVTSLQDAIREVAIICNESTFSFQLLSRVYGAFSPTFIIDHPPDWWLQIDHGDNLKNIYRMFSEIPEMAYGIELDTLLQIKVFFTHRLEKIRKLTADTILALLKKKSIPLRDVVTAQTLLAEIRSAYGEFWAAEEKSGSKLTNYLRQEIQQCLAENEKFVVYRMGSSKDRGMYERIIKYLDFPDLEYIDMAVCALDMLGDERAIEPLAKLLKEMQSDRIGTMEKYYINEFKYREEIDWLQWKLNSMRERVK